MWDLLTDGVAAIISSIIIYTAISGFLYDVTLRRLTKPSFTISPADIADLFFAYSIGMLSFLFINAYIKSVYVSSGTTDGILLALNSKESVVIVGLIVLFIGRVITRRQGIFFGKLHFSALFVTSSILLLIDFVSKGKFNLNILASNFNFYSPAFIYTNCINTALGYIYYLFEGDTYSSKYIVLALAGTIYLSVVGEWYLSLKPSNAKSFLSVVDKLPTGFRVIPDEKKIKEAVDDMFKGDVIRVKCVSRALNHIDYLKEPIERQFRANEERTEELKLELDYKILIAPEKKAEDDYIEFIKNLPFSVMNKFMDKGKLLNDFKVGYTRRRSILSELENNGMIESKVYYYGDLKYLIIVDNNGFKRILFIVRDKTTVNGRVGVYSDQIYIINIFENLFDRSWN